jgi:RNA polymerase sigma factor (sigma-70 family)
MDERASNWSDEEIIRRVIAGEVDDFEYLMERHEAAVFRIVGRRVPRADLEEVAHDAFVRAYVSLPGFRGKGDFGAWLMKIAVRACYDYWREKYKRREQPMSSLSKDQVKRLARAAAEEAARSDAGRAASRESRELLMRAMSSSRARAYRGAAGERSRRTIRLEHGECEGPRIPVEEETPRNPRESDCGGGRNVMKKRPRVIDDMETRLFSVYRVQECVPPGAGWRQSVMGELRRLGPLTAAGNGEAAFGRLAWRFSMAAVFVALVLLAYVLSSGFVDYQDLAMQYLANPMDFII